MFIIPIKQNRFKKSIKNIKYYQDKYIENKNYTFNELDLYNNTTISTTYLPNIKEIPITNPLQFFIFLCMYSLWFGTFTRKEIQHFFSEKKI
tara:strand:+ start:2391 stop:2666 length:276 start_codon:yes stop_codon:yes gene_type:complete